MNNQNTISSTGSAMMGAGLVLIQNNLNTGLLLIGVGVVLTILVAVLNKYNIPVSSNLG
jgi:uncharacterized membrane protein